MQKEKTNNSVSLNLFHTSRRLLPTRAFTLIELLVVVLIIGILAVIALPQYQKTIDKSHYARLMAAARDIANAQEIFYLEHGHYALNLDNLPITLMEQYNKNNMSFYNGGSYLHAAYVDKKGTFIASYTIYYRFGGNSYDGNTYCFTYKTAYRERGKNICLGFGGKLKRTDSSCSVNSPCEHYFLNN